MSDPLRLFVIARDDAPHVQEAWNAVRTALKRRKGVEILGVASAADAELQRPDDAELAIVIGGDGAILRVCRAFGFGRGLSSAALLSGLSRLTPRVASAKALRSSSALGMATPADHGATRLPV